MVRASGRLGSNYYRGMHSLVQNTARRASVLCQKKALQVRSGLANPALPSCSHEDTMVNPDIPTILEQRLGRRHARQRLGIEKDHEAQVFGQGINFFHIENLVLSRVLIRAALIATGLYRRGIRNAAKVGIRHNRVESPNLPKAFDGFTIVQLSDLHVEMSEAAMERVIALLGEVRYDLCVLTGDYRGATTVHTTGRSPEWRSYELASRARSTACSAIMTPFAWSLDWRRWE